MEKVIEARRRSLLICGGWVVATCGRCSLIPPFARAHWMPWAALLLKPLKNRQFCLLRAKAFCGFFNIKEAKGKEKIL